MSRCRYCNVEILDETEFCPLCHSVLEQTEEMENAYPNAVHSSRLWLFMSRIYLFAAIIAEIILILMDYNTNNNFSWSIIAGFVLLYLYTFFRYVILGQTGYKSKIIIAIAVTVLIALVVDYATGFKGWSTDYVISSGLMLMSLGILILMLINRRNWQSYLMWQIHMIFLGFLPVLLYRLGIEHNPYFAYAPVIFAVLIFVGTLLLGGQRALTELQRRFHI